MRKKVNRFISIGIAVGLLIFAGSFVFDLFRGTSKPSQEITYESDYAEVTLSKLFNDFNQINPVNADVKYGGAKLKVTGCHITGIVREGDGYYTLYAKIDGEPVSTECATILVTADVLSEADINLHDKVTVYGVPSHTVRIRTQMERYTSVKINKVPRIVFEKHEKID